MVIPIVGEAEWGRRFKDLPGWMPSDQPTIVVAPHPDDETLAAGGLIAAQRARGVDVLVVAVTDGEHAYMDNRGLARRREEEQTLALARLGVTPDRILRLRLGDSAVALQETRLLERLASVVTNKTQVLAPWTGDFHPDHEACGRAAKRSVEGVGATLISYFFWSWHRGTPAALDGLPLRRFNLNDDMVRAKLAALACHQSQLEHEPEAEILPEDLLWPARLPFEVFAV